MSDPTDEEMREYLRSHGWDLWAWSESWKRAVDWDNGRAHPMTLDGAYNQAKADEKRKRRRPRCKHCGRCMGLKHYAAGGRRSCDEESGHCEPDHDFAAEQL